MIDVSFEGFRYHKPLPDFYKIENPENPKREIAHDLLDELTELVHKYDFTGMSYSKLSSDFKSKFNTDIDNIIIFKFLMDDEILNKPQSREKGKLMDIEFQEYGVHIYEFADFLRQNGFQADLIHPLDDNLSLRSIAMQSNDCVITRNNMCYFKDGLNNSFFMIHTSIDNLPFKKENDMLWVNEFCKTCGVCIERCPENAFDEDERVLRKVCTAHKQGCNECLLKCPFYKRGYDKVKKRYERMKRRENV